MEPIPPAIIRYIGLISKNTIHKMLGKQLVLRDLFDYKYIPTGMEYKHGILVAKNGVYTYKYNYNNFFSYKSPLDILY